MASRGVWACVRAPASMRACVPALARRALSSTACAGKAVGAPVGDKLTINGQTFATDDYTNVPQSILQRVAPSPVLPYLEHHPLALLRGEIERILGPAYAAIRAPSPVVSTELNFDQLGFPQDHPGRRPTDTYYVNRTTCLRTHTSAHEVETFVRGHSRWVLTADVFRRDEIDGSHYPVFHQMEGASVWHPSELQPDGPVEAECEALEARLAATGLEIVDDVDLEEAGGWQARHREHFPRETHLVLRHLKATLNTLMHDLFQPRNQQESEESHVPLRVRWIPAFFPFTSPSFEVEVLFRGHWYELLGTGVVQQRTMDEAGTPDRIGWAFGLGLERIAMVLYGIPDIRLFWSTDQRFLNQFRKQESRDARLITFKPYSKYPPCYKDVSFWMPEGFHENDLFETVRDAAGDLVEDVTCIDDFVHPKTQRHSRCYRVNYRSMDRNLENDQVNALHAHVLDRLQREFRLEIR